VKAQRKQNEKKKIRRRKKETQSENKNFSFLRSADFLINKN
jgi:hypothetical protein